MSGNLGAMEDAIPMKNFFGVVDYVILALMLVVSLVIGIMTGFRKFTSTKDFLAGDRNMNPYAVSLSLIGGIISAISVQGNSTETYLYGTQLWMNLIGNFVGTFFVMFLILPVVYPLNVVSVCQYLEMRFKSPFLKKLGSMVLIIKHCMYMGICLYAPSLTLSSAIGIPVYVSIVICGSVCAVYITLGGARAVVYTDVMQTTLMFVGVLVVVVQVTLELGGISVVWNIADEGKRLEFFNLDPSLLVRHTFWSVQVLGIYSMLNLGTGQAPYQRLVSVRSLRISQWLCLSFFGGLCILWSLFYLAGIVAYAAYSDCDPVSNGQVEKPDQILAFMVADKLSHNVGMVGLFVAAVAGAVLSSLSSVANSTVVLLWEDFLSGWWVFAKVSQGLATKITKMLSTAMIIIGICLAFLVSKMGTIFQLNSTIMGAFGGPFCGLFIMGITAPWVNNKGAIIGFMVALTFNIWMALSQFYYGAGRSEVLPMSTEGCEVENVSLSGDPVSLWLPITTMAVPLQNVTHKEEKLGYPAMYDISYCYIGTIGIIIVFVASSIASFFTGMVKPSEVDHSLVNSFCLRIYCRMSGQHKLQQTELLSFKTTSPRSKDGSTE